MENWRFPVFPMDEEYFLSKSRNSIFHRNIVRNALAHLGMAHLKTECILIKSIHVADENSDFDEMEFDDLTPDTMYSLNKRRRWETEQQLGERILERAIDFHEGTVDVVLLERVNLKTFEWKYVPWVRYPKDFLIRCIHRLEKSENQETYEKSELNTIFGQPYSHFLKENRKSTKQEKEEKTSLQNSIVAYNFIRAPKNYMRLGEQFFVDSNYGPNFFPPYQGYCRRIAKLEDCKMQIRYYQEEVPEDVDDQETDSESPVDLPKPSSHYNFSDHLISDFVFVKRRKVKVPMV